MPAYVTFRRDATLSLQPSSYFENLDDYIAGGGVFPALYFSKTELEFNGKYISKFFSSDDAEFSQTLISDYGPAWINAGTEAQAQWVQLDQHIVFVESITILAVQENFSGPYEYTSNSYSPSEYFTAPSFASRKGNFSETISYTLSLLDKPASLFTEGADEVSFNSLLPAQSAAAQSLQGSAALYQALGGDDRIALPDLNAVVPGGYDQSNVFNGGAGNDVVQGGSRADRIDGGSDNDRILASPGADDLRGGSGNDKFDYTSGRFANFDQFGSAAVKQTIDGGTQAPLAKDIVLLPLAADNYDVSVILGSDWAHTLTRIHAQTGETSTPVTLDMNEVEQALFSVPVAKSVSLTAQSVPVEMLRLASEVYASKVYGTKPTLPHLAEPLASNSLTGTAAVDSIVTSSASLRNWHPVSALELGISPKNFSGGDYAGLEWSFIDGHYAALKQVQDGFNPVGSVYGDKAEANAMVVSGVVPGYGKTLAVVFRGTDQFADWDSYANFQKHYDLFKPLIDGVRSYIKDPATGPKIEHVLVSGHSLGGAMAQYFMNDVGAGDSRFQAWTEGAPGAEVHGNSQILNIVNSDDPVTLAPIATSGTQLFGSFLLTNPAFAVAGAALLTLGTLTSKSRDGTDLLLDSDVNEAPTNFDEHDKYLYVMEMQKLLDFARDSAGPFAKEAAATGLLSGDAGALAGLRIAVGKPASGASIENPVFDTIVRGYSGDRFVLANNSSDDRVVISDHSSSPQRIIDGGTGVDILELTNFLQSEVSEKRVGDGVQLIDRHDSSVISTVHRIEYLAFKDVVMHSLAASGLNIQLAPAGTAVLQVSSAADYTEAGDGAMSVKGTSQRDTVYVGNGSKTVDLGDGDDVMIARDDRSIDPLFVSGGGGSDFARGAGGEDQLSGGDGDDKLAGLAGNDRLDGGAGNDTADYSSATAALTINLGSGIATGSDVDTDVLISIENVHGGTGNDLIIGDDLANTLQGMDGDDTIFAQAGNDALDGGEGNDTLVGNADIFAKESDTLQGVNGNDIIYGEFTDNINGGSGFDILYAVNGYDWTFDLGATSIELFIADFGNDTIKAATQSVGVEVVASGGNDTIDGSGFGDRLWAGVGNDVVHGGGGDDMLFGDFGADSLFGDAGNDIVYADAADTIDGGADFDVVYMTTGNGVAFDMVAASVEFFIDQANGTNIITAAGMSIGANIYTGSGSDSIVGSSLDDVLWGLGGNDTIDAGAGDDVLVGGAGTDLLTPGSGADRVYMNSNGGDGLVDRLVLTSGWGNDTVYDFEQGVDKIDMTALHTSFGALAMSAAANGSVVVTLSGDQLIVVGLAGSLTDADFLF